MSDRGRAEEHRPAAHPHVDDDRAGETARAPAAPAELLALQQGAGNRAVAALVVQRHAFVRDKQVKPSHPSLTPAMKAMAADTTVRDYHDGGEFADHAARKTDHIGTLRAGSPGTWVRFPKTGSNLLGEAHDHVKLDHVVAAATPRRWKPRSPCSPRWASRARPTPVSTARSRCFPRSGTA